MKEVVGRVTHGGDREACGGEQIGRLPRVPKVDQVALAQQAQHVEELKNLDRGMVADDVGE